MYMEIKSDLTRENAERDEVTKLGMPVDKKEPNKKDIFGSLPNYNDMPKKGFVRLYHNTPDSNIDSIKKNGLVQARPESVREKKPGYDNSNEGTMIWSTREPDQRGYGGTTIAFDMPEKWLDKEFSRKNGLHAENLNDTEVGIYKDISPENIRFIDKPVFDNLRIGDFVKYMPEMGKEKIFNVLSEHGNFEEELKKHGFTIEQFKQLLDYIEENQ